MVPPGLPALPLVLYVHEGKTGSSTVRHVLQAAQSASSQDQWLCELSDSSNVTFETCQHSDVVIGPALYGTCSLFRRPCRYFTVMREPVDRLVSSYNYFCLSCKENGKFCWTNVQAERLWNASCPSMSFLEYTAIYANMYTWHFGRRVMPYYDNMHQGFAHEKPLANSDFVAARRALTQPDMLLIQTDELDGGAWDRLERWLSGTRAAAAMRHSRQKNETTHRHAALAYAYTPTAAERERTCTCTCTCMYTCTCMSCVINHFDCELYKSLRSRVDAAP